jgi:HEAT repeat protein
MSKKQAGNLIQILNTPRPSPPSSHDPKAMIAYRRALAADITAKKAAAEALGNARVSQAVPALMHNLTDPNASLRRTVADALIKVRNRTIVSRLTAMLKSQTVYERRTAAYVLGGLRDQRAVAGLNTLVLRDSNATVRAAAARALGKIGTSNVLQSLYYAISQDQSAAVRYSATRAFTDLLNSNPRMSARSTVFQALLNAFWDHVPRVSSAAIDAITSITNLSRPEKILAGQMLIRVLRTHPNQQVRHDAILVLGRLAIATHDRRLIRGIQSSLLKDPSSSIRIAAAQTLGILGNRMSVPTLIRALKDRHPQVRLNAANSLGHIGDRRAVRPLIRTLGDTNADVRAYAAGALGSIGDRRALRPLIRAITDSAHQVRAAAAEALGKLGHRRATIPLTRLLQDSQSHVREAAAEALAKIGDRRALGALQTALNSERVPDVRRAMTRAITEIRRVNKITIPPPRRQPARSRPITSVQEDEPRARARA